MHIAPWSEDDIRQLLNCGQWFLFWKETKLLSVIKNHDNQTSTGITRLIQPFSSQSVRCVLYLFSFHSYVSSQFSFQVTVNYVRRILFFESDHATMFGRFSIWMMWTGNCSDVLRSTKTFQSLAPFSSFILEVFLFHHRAFTFLVKLNYRFLRCKRLMVCCFTLCS